MKMVSVAARKTRLYEKMIRSLGDALWTYSDMSKRPLVLQLIRPYKIEVTVYLFLGTNPPGGRRDGEYKITLTSPGQQRRARGNFEGGTGIPLILAYIEDYDVYVFFNNRYHTNFGFNTNVQFKQQLVFEAVRDGVSRMTKGNGETIIGARGRNIVEGFKEWFKVLCS